MIVPTKLIPANKSLIYKAMQLLEKNSDDLSYTNNYRIFSNIIEYADVMTILFALGYIDDKRAKGEKNDTLSE